MEKNGETSGYSSGVIVISPSPRNQMLQEQATKVISNESETETIMKTRNGILNHTSDETYY
jgi:hypothetical protein